MFWAPPRTSSRQPPDFASGLSGGAFTWRGRVLRFYLARHPAVFVGPAPWSSCRSGEAPAAGTKTFAGCRARIPLRPLALKRPA